MSLLDGCAVSKSPFSGGFRGSPYLIMKNTSTIKVQERMLTAHFSLREMCASGTAIRLGIKNEPSEEVINRLQQLCEHVLEPLRQRFGVIRITSGYRCERLNKAVGGVKNSQHRLGEAADIHVSNIEVGRKMFQFIKENLDFDQLLFERIRENGVCWLHVSYKKETHPAPPLRGRESNVRRNRRQAIDNYVVPPRAEELQWEY